MKETVFFSLGSNLGDRRSQLEAGLDGLGRFCRGLVSSRIYETEPMYDPRQPFFLNLAAMGAVTVPPSRLLGLILALEERLGRKRYRRFGARRIDIDILLYGDRVYESTELVIPHPRLLERRFVLIPLLELAPRLRHPVMQEPLWKYLEKIEHQGVYFHSFSRYTMSSLKPGWMTLLLRRGDKSYGRNEISSR